MAVRDHQTARGQGNLAGALRPVSSVAVRVDLDPWLSLSGLAGYSGLSVRTLRALLRHARHPMPHYRLGEAGSAGRRGAKILIRRSEFDKWMAAWRCEQAPPPRDLSGLLDAAVAAVKGLKRGTRSTAGQPQPEDETPTKRRLGRDR